MGENSLEIRKDGVIDWHVKEAREEDGEWEPWRCGVIVVGRELGLLMAL